MKNEVKYERVITRVSVQSEYRHTSLRVGDEVGGQEIFSLRISKNATELFTATACDENGNAIYTLNVHEPKIVEVFQKVIAVDGPAE